VNVQDYIQSGIIESYVLGMANEEEATELLQLSHQYPEIQQAIDSFEISLEANAFKNAVAVPADIKENLLNLLKDDFAVPLVEEATTPVVSLQQTSFNQAPVKSIGSRLKYIAAASTILLVVSTGLNYYFYNQYQTSKNNYLALLKENISVTADNKVYQTKMIDLYNGMQIMSDPNMIKVEMPGVPGKETSLTTVFWNKNTKDVYLLANKLPQAAEGKQYQLWALVDGKPVDAGLLEDCNGVCKLKNIPKAQAFAITLEDKGGSASPHLDQLYVIGNVSS
jgi:anti-sigma-K factor RskA